MSLISLLGSALFAAAGMFWSIFWALVLGFALSGVVMAFVPKKKIAQALGRPGLKELGRAMLFGAASSSCSYAAAAMTRSLFRKGAHIIPALAFLLASTNLVVELSAVLWILMGWQFVAAEVLGGVVLVLSMATLMRLFAPLEAFEEKRRELAAAGGNSEESGEETADPKTLEGWKEVARHFVMEWKMIGRDILLGVVISGFLMVLVPDSFWQSLFLQNGLQTSGYSHLVQVVENALVGPVISMISFVCSVGNIPLASVLYHGGITFGGAIAFIYADLIIIPLILVYRRYFGWKLTIWITGVFYVSMVFAGIAVDLLFDALGWIPARHEMGEMQHMHFFEFNYTFWLNLVFFLLAALLVGLARSGSEKGKGAADCCH